MNSNVEGISRINPFLPNLLFGHDICAGIETLSKTSVKRIFYFHPKIKDKDKMVTAHHDVLYSNYKLQVR